MPREIFRLSPDWDMMGTAAQINLELRGIKFKSPGWYLSPTDSVLIVPTESDKPITRDNLWNTIWPEGTMFKVYVYNTSVDMLIFNATPGGSVPTREDTRHSDGAE